MVQSKKVGFCLGNFSYASICSAQKMSEKSLRKQKTLQSGMFVLLCIVDLITDLIAYRDFDFVGFVPQDCSTNVPSLISGVAVKHEKNQILTG